MAQAPVQISREFEQHCYCVALEDDVDLKTLFTLDIRPLPLLGPANLHQRA